MGAHTTPLPTHEIAVGGRGNALPGQTGIPIHAHAHRAARLTPLQTRFKEDLVEPLGLGLTLDQT